MHAVHGSIISPTMALYKKMMEGQGPSDVWGQLNQQNVTTLIEIWPECKRGSGHKHGHVQHLSYCKPVHLSFNRKDWQGEPPSSLNLFLDDATLGGTD